MKRVVSFVVALSLTSCLSAPKKEAAVESPTNAITERHPAAVDANQAVHKAWQAIVADRKVVDDLLSAKAHVLTQTQNYKADGSLRGEVSGQFNMNHGINLKGALIGGLAGLALSPLAGAAALHMGSAMGLNTILALGVGGGTAAGALAPAKKAEGKIEGKIEGSYKAEGWENHKEASHFAVLVVDPGAFQQAESLGREKSTCAKGVQFALKSIIDSGRYFTPAEALRFTEALGRIRANTKEIDSHLMDPDLKNAAAADGLVKRIEAWSNKRLSLYSLVRHGVQAQALRGVRVSVPTHIQLVPGRCHSGWDHYHEVKKAGGLTEWQGVLHAVRPSSSLNTKEDWDSVLYQWGLAAEDVFEKTMKHSRAKWQRERCLVVKVNGRDLANLKAYAKTARYEAGLYSGAFSDRVQAEVQDVSQIWTYAAAGLSCAGSADAREFMERTSQSMETYFNMVDVPRMSQLLTPTRPVVLPEATLESTAVFH